MLFTMAADGKDVRQLTSLPGDLTFVNGGGGTMRFTSTGRLTVAGLIESTSGGVKFPDGSTQVTAATAGLGGSIVDVLTRRTSLTLSTMMPTT